MQIIDDHIIIIYSNVAKKNIDKMEEFNVVRKQPVMCNVLHLTDFNTVDNNKELAEAVVFFFFCYPKTFTS